MKSKFDCFSVWVSKIWDVFLRTIRKILGILFALCAFAFVLLIITDNDKVFMGILAIALSVAAVALLKPHAEQKHHKQRKTATANADTGETVVFFEHGQVVKMIPEPEGSYYDYDNRGRMNCSYRIVSDGRMYDLRDKKSVKSIKVPKYVYVNNNPVSNDLGVTGYLEYVLRMHPDPSLACLEKACLLMKHSTVGWSRPDYKIIVKEYLRRGNFLKANEWSIWIKKHTESLEELSKSAFQRTLDSCRFLNTDLIETTSEKACCEICAKYRSRVFSLSGRDRRFLKFPSDFHFGCLLTHPFIEGGCLPVFLNGKDYVDYIEYSNRPLIDDRSDEEISEHISRLESSAKWDSVEPDLNHIIYYYFKPLFPNDFPKSLSGFSKMRNLNSANYQKLMRKIQKAGFKVPNSLSEAAELESSWSPQEKLLRNQYYQNM